MILEHVCCDLCGEEDYTVRYRKPDNWLWLNPYEYPVVECVGCGLVYVNPRPTFEEMNSFYPVGYHDERNDTEHLFRYRAQFEYIAAFPAKKVLDIGCARGDWLNYLHGLWPYVELHGTDAFSEHVNFQDIQFQRGSLQDVDLPEAYFDLITSWAVFEHVHTPNAYFEVVSKVLSPGGKVILLVTNSESIYGRYAYKEDIPRHLYHFSESSLRKYAEKHGLVLEKVAYDERFWDGSGNGAFRLGVARLAGISWRDIYTGRLSFVQKILLRFGSALDAGVFFYKWEARARRSGIIVATFSKG